MPAGTARRSTRDRAAEATRRRILKVVEALLAEGGPEAASIRAICLRAEVTPPTVYHHFGDKQALIDRVVEACFHEFDRSMVRRRTPADPVEALRVGFDRYVAYGLRHPSHYRVIFQHRPARRTAAGLASYDRLRAAVARIAECGRLRTTVDEGAFAFWCTAHGVTSLLINGFHPPGDTVALLRDALIERLTTPPRSPGRKGAPHDTRE